MAQYIKHLKALVFLYALKESVDCPLLSSFCDDSNLYISLFKYVLSAMGVSKESISKFLIENQFHLKLRIVSPIRTNKDPLNTLKHPSNSYQKDSVNFASYAVAILPSMEHKWLKWSHHMHNTELHNILRFILMA